MFSSLVASASIVLIESTSSPYCIKPVNLKTVEPVRHRKNVESKYIDIACPYYNGEKVESISTPEAEATREENTFYSLSAMHFVY